MALLEVHNLTKSYLQRGASWAAAGDEKRVVDQVSFSIERGETLGLIGESGSGKSTIARMVLGLLPPTSGNVLFDGQSVTNAHPSTLRKLRRRFQPVFQDPFAALNPRMTIGRILAEPFKIHHINSSVEELAHEVRRLMETVGLDRAALGRYPHEFSGGQRQRINIARALALRPELLVLDEPLSSLDVSVAAQIANLLRRLQQEFNLTYLFISHSMPLVRYLSTNIAVLHHGKLLEFDESERLCRHPQTNYSQTLIAATPRHPGDNF